jgi:trigger factor
MSDRSQTDVPADTEAEPEARPKLDLEVKIDSKSACQRHITVTIPQVDIERYYGDAFTDLMEKAAVRGFRQGRAPRKLVENWYRKDVADQVKGSLLMDSLSQITEDHPISPISEPDFDPTAIVVPKEGPMTFEFDIEVRPEFDLPNWKGLKLQRPVKKFTDADVDDQLQNLLAQRGQLVPLDAPAEPGNYVQVNIVFKAGGAEISRLDEQTLRIRPTLSFRDGNIEDFDKLMTGAKAGDVRSGEADISADAPNEALRGQKVTAEFHVLEVKRLDLPKLTHAFLDELGGFENEDELRKAIRESLERRLDYHQHQEARKQILASLTVAADWDLPPELLKRQSRREMERTVLELRRSGFGEDEIRSHGNELMQNSQASTARSLKEHFILERIAEDEKIEDEPADYDHEIELIAEQSGESPRRVRAQLEKRNLMDTLRNQIIERKVIDLILKNAAFKDVPYKAATTNEAVDYAAGGEEADIPEAMHSEPGKIDFTPPHPT